MFNFIFKHRRQMTPAVLSQCIRVSTGCALLSIAISSQANLSLNELNEKVTAYQQTQKVWQQQKEILQLERKHQLSWQNPILTVQQTGLKNTQEQELEVSISQPIDVFSVRRKAADVVMLQAEQLVLLEKSTQQQQALALEYFWVQLHLLSQEVALLKQQLQMSQDNLDATKQRFKAGSIAQLDVERVNVQHLDLQATYAQQAQALQVMKRQLSHLWGENTTDYELSNLAHLTQNSLLEQQSMNSKSNVNVSLMQLQNRQSEAQLAYLKAQAKPMPTVSLGMVSSQDAESKVKDQQVRVGLEIPLAIFQRQQYRQQIEKIKMQGVVEAQSRYQHRTALSSSTIEAEYDMLYVQYQQIMQQQIPLVSSIKEKTSLGFMAGKYTVTDVQLATTALKQYQLHALQMKKQLWSKYLQQKAVLLGISFEQISNTNAVSDLNQTVWRNSTNLPVVGGE
ncbi:TolC family protein [Acinetobacter boissieri]|uniref:Outer membrane protein, cobalt-zinc-cadmium efflux system n=1 Tax=Acinetobacter boissieri TaxID=1219383 RepID=A0A1G6H0R8_9GAMM|nr:TolC family protein [Acinetobacter boissieri]SDB87849.1 outer membrane protein, cobalt-zinc-cadmium efflux system [Acinetobacter boissieri]